MWRVCKKIWRVSKKKGSTEKDTYEVLHSCLYSVLQAGAEAAPYPEEAELPRPLLYWLCALLAILWLRPKLRRRPAYWDSREKGFASAPRRHNEAQTSCN